MLESHAASKQTVRGGYSPEQRAEIGKYAVEKWSYQRSKALHCCVQFRVARAIYAPSAYRLRETTLRGS